MARVWAGSGWGGVVLAALVGVAWPGAGRAAEPGLHRGFNVYPWLYRARPLPPAEGAPMLGRLYPFVQAFTPADFRALKRSGVDFIRVPLDPTPLLLADEAGRGALLAGVAEALGRLREAGLTAVLDLHPAENGGGWGAADIIHTPAKWQAYRAVAVATARVLAASGRPGLVLELMNEPQGGWGRLEGAMWLDLQPDLVRAVRAVAPALPLVVSGDRGGTREGLLRLDPTGWDDPAILYSFHDYDPMVVTHQGADWGNAAYRRDLLGVSYPPVPAEAAGVLAAFRARVAADPSVPAQTKAEDVESGSAALAAYLDGRAGRAGMARDFAEVRAWGRRHGIAPGRILLGEFGVYRPGATRETAIAWTRDMRLAAEQAGFAWAYFNYAPFDENGKGFSVLRMTGPSPASLDAAFLREGLGLDP